MAPAQRLELSVVRDPAGRPAVLLQLPDAWITLLPADARRLALELVAVAIEAEGDEDDGDEDRPLAGPFNPGR